MKKLIPSFSNLSDTEFEGMFFKDEGSYLAVKFDTLTQKPAVGDTMYPFGQLTSLSINRAVIKSLNTTDNPIQSLHDYFQSRYKEKVG